MTDYIHDMMKKLLEQSEETQKTVISLDKKVDLHIQKTEIQLEQIHKLDEQQNDILEEHHKRSDGLAKDNILRERALKLELDKYNERTETKLDTKASKEDIADLKRKLEEVQKPHLMLQYFVKVLMYAGTVAGAIYGFYQVYSIYHH